MVRYLGEDGAEVGFRIDAVEFGGLDQRQDAGGTLAALVGAGEQPVFAPKAEACFIMHSIFKCL